MLIVIEGIDGSGKETQTNLLEHRLKQHGPVRTLNFPDYKSDTSALVKLYLAGRFGTDAMEVNPYTASSFYAVDRIGSYLMNWKQDYLAGTTILCDRYTTSNAIHQASKLSGESRDAYLSWLFQYEYQLLQLPEPDLVVFLDMPPAYGKKLTAKRNNKITGASQKDIHERDEAYLKACYETALYVAKQYGWKVIPCVNQGEIRPIEEIHDEIYMTVMKLYDRI
jgi:dTMP kinase